MSLCHLNVVLMTDILDRKVQHFEAKAAHCIARESLQSQVRGCLDHIGEEVNDAWEGLLDVASNALSEVLVGVNVSQDDDQDLGYLCEEVLVVYHLLLLQVLLNPLPYPRVLYSILRLLLREESGNKVTDQVLREQRVKHSLVIGTGKCKGHEGELKHVVLGLKVAVRGDDLAEGCLHDGYLALCWRFLGDVDRA